MTFPVWPPKLDHHELDPYSAELENDLGSESHFETETRSFEHIATSPSSRGLGHRPFTAVTGVRIPLGTPVNPKRPALCGSFWIDRHPNGDRFEPRVRTEASEAGRQTHERSECARRASRVAASQSPWGRQTPTRPPCVGVLVFDVPIGGSGPRSTKRVSVLDAR